MKSLFRIWLVLAALCLSLSLAAQAQLVEYGDGGPGPYKAQHLTVELTSLGPAVAPGGTQTVGLVITLEEHWHVYWINAGDSGQPPHVTWTLPPGITMGAMQFPAPSRLPLGPLMDFGYEDTAAFPFTLTAAPGAKPGPIHLDAKVTWLVCSSQCIPGKAHLGMDLTVAPGAQLGPPIGALGEGLKDLPVPLPAKMQFSALGGKDQFVLTLKTGTREEDGEFYPIDPDLIVNAADQDIEPLPDGLRIRVKRAPELQVLPATIHGLVKLSDTEVFDVDAPLTPGELPYVPPPGTAAAGGAEKLSALTAIGFAFLGGILLNLMPCVFPVLFLKGLALVQSSGEERGRMRSHGLVYTLGILVSFWVIVGLLLLIRHGGSQAGWGFQLQSPGFVVVLASFLFFFALSLAGQFELGLSLTSAGGSLAQKHGFAGSFFTGILATVVATPCVGPFMGAAIGFALSQPALVTFAVFTALGLGLAVPYLALTIQPAWIKLLPRPGIWMEYLKQFCSVPLFATAIGLAWVYGQLYTSDAADGVNHVARLLFAFLVLAIAGWALGRWPARWASGIAAVLLCGTALAIPLVHTAPDKLDWQPYTQATLDAARATGRPVFIDFTAAWCLSCHVNEETVLNSSEVEKQLIGHNFILLRADWTKYDPAITQQLASVGRSGVPTYVFYPAGPAGKADVLPELLSKSVVLDAIKRDAK